MHVIFVSMARWCSEAARASRTPEACEHLLRAMHHRGDQESLHPTERKLNLPHCKSTVGGGENEGEASGIRLGEWNALVTIMITMIISIATVIRGHSSSFVSLSMTRSDGGWCTWVRPPYYSFDSRKGK